MMLRLLWWGPLGVFVLFWAILGLRYGWLAANTAETDVINTFAARYVNDHGAQAALTDCLAYPADDINGVWLVVSCAPLGGSGSYDYYVNRLGGLEFSDQPDTPAVPKT